MLEDYLQRRHQLGNAARLLVLSQCSGIGKAEAEEFRGLAESVKWTGQWNNDSSGCLWIPLRQMLTPLCLTQLGNLKSDIDRFQQREWLISLGDLRMLKDIHYTDYDGDDLLHALAYTAPEYTGLKFMARVPSLL